MRGVMIILLLIMSAFCVEAQKKDKLIIDVLPPAGKVAPLYVIGDMVVSKDKVAKIKADDVAEMQVINKPGSVELYGKEGENGVVIIKLKSEFAPPKNNFIVTSGSVFYLDGKKISNAEAEQLNPDDMAEQNLSRYPIGVLSDGKSQKDVLNLISRKFAIASYQKVFGDRSKAYKNLVKNDSADDVIYMVNGAEVLKDKDQAGKLYRISQVRIQNVVFVPKKKNAAAQLVISTKK